MHRAFVYGTLKRNGLNNYLFRDSNNGQAKFICKGSTVEKFPLVIATEANIPFLLDFAGHGNNIQGEVWEVDDQMLKVMDELEKTPKLYKRTPLRISTAQSESTNVFECDTYVLHNFDPKLLELEKLTMYEDSKEKPFVMTCYRKAFDIYQVKNN